MLLHSDPESFPILVFRPREFFLGVQWLEAHEQEVQLDASKRTPKTFIPREVYSRYLKSTLLTEAEQSKKVDFREIHDEAVDTSVQNDNVLQVSWLPTAERLLTERFWDLQIDYDRFIDAAFLHENYHNAAAKLCRIFIDSNVIVAQIHKYCIPID